MKELSILAVSISILPLPFKYCSETLLVHPLKNTLVEVTSAFPVTRCQSQFSVTFYVVEYFLLLEVPFTQLLLVSSFFYLIVCFSSVSFVSFSSPKSSL